VGGAPVVIKLLEGTQGIGVILAPQVKVAEAIIETLHSTKQNVLIQKFIAESRGRDIRALVVGDRVVAAMRRSASGDEFRSNVHRGGSVERFGVVPDMVTLGKALTGLRAVNVATLERPKFWRGAVVRYLVLSASFLLPLIGPLLVIALSPLFDPQRRRRGWPDLAAAMWIVDIKKGLNPYDAKRMRIARKTVATDLKDEKASLPSLATPVSAPTSDVYIPVARNRGGVVGAPRERTGAAPAGDGEYAGPPAPIQASPFAGPADPYAQPAPLPSRGPQAPVVPVEPARPAPEPAASVLPASPPPAAAPSAASADATIHAAICGRAAADADATADAAANALVDPARLPSSTARTLA
jgi:hypothetical protein